MKYMFPICVFENSGYCRIEAIVPHQDFWLLQIDLCPDLKLSMGNYLRIILPGLGPNENKLCLGLNYCQD